MFIDASVIVSILGIEDDGAELLKRVKQSTSGWFVSPLVVYEASTSLASKLARDAGSKRDASLLTFAEAEVRVFLGRIGAIEMGIDSDLGRRALEAARTFGRAVNHPANLNFGDCFAYACAKARDIPLLYKGNDFPQTDLA